MTPVGAVLLACALAGPARPAAAPAADLREACLRWTARVRVAAEACRRVRDERVGLPELTWEEHSKEIQRALLLPGPQSRESAREPVAEATRLLEEIRVLRQALGGGEVDLTTWSQILRWNYRLARSACPRQAAPLALELVELELDRARDVGLELAEACVEILVEARPSQDSLEGVTPLCNRLLRSAWPARGLGDAAEHERVLAVLEAIAELAPGADFAPAARAISGFSGDVTAHVLKDVNERLEVVARTRSGRAGLRGDRILELVLGRGYTAGSPSGRRESLRTFDPFGVRLVACSRGENTELALFGTDAPQSPGSAWIAPGDYALRVEVDGDEHWILLPRLEPGTRVELPDRLLPGYATVLDGEVVWAFRVEPLSWAEIAGALSDPSLEPELTEKLATALMQRPGLAEAGERGWRALCDAVALLAPGQGLSGPEADAAYQLWNAELPTRDEWARIEGIAEALSLEHPSRSELLVHGGERGVGEFWVRPKRKLVKEPSSD